LANIPGITHPHVPDDINHGYYVYALTIDPEKLGIDRGHFAAAIKAEGIPIYEGYAKPIYWQPLYQQKTLYGGTGCPFSCPHYQGNVSYAKGICPVTERLHEHELLYGDWCHADITEDDINDIIVAVKKVVSATLDSKSGEKM
jgi:perosamine synthetase